MQELKEKGNEFFKRGDHAEALKLYSQAIELAGSNPEAADKSQLHLIYCNRAASLLSLERYQEAIDDCEKVMELEPKFLKAYLRKAIGLRALGHLTKALEIAQAGLAIDNNPKSAAVPELNNMVRAIQADIARLTQPNVAKSRGRKSAKEAEELAKEYNEVLGEVEQLNVELESRERSIKMSKLTQEYLASITATGETPNTFVQTGRMFLQRPLSHVTQELDSKITKLSGEFSLFQEKMKSNESKLKSMSAELEEILKRV